MAQIKRLYPSLTLVDCRGNVPTRLRKLDNVEADPRYNYDALILAAAGLLRIDLGHRISEYLDAPDLLYAVGQGALGIEIRAGDHETQALLAGLTHAKTANACYAERALLRTLEGGCSVPIGVKTTWEGEKLRLRGRVCSVDGTETVETVLEAEVRGQAEAEALGKRVARELLERGAGPILVRIEREKKEAVAGKEAAKATVAGSVASDGEMVEDAMAESLVFVESMDD